MIAARVAFDLVAVALLDPAAIEENMFGTHVETDWRVGSPVTWRGD